MCSSTNWIFMQLEPPGYNTCPFVSLALHFLKMGLGSSLNETQYNFLVYPTAKLQCLSLIIHYWISPSSSRYGCQISTISSKSHERTDNSQSSMHCSYWITEILTAVLVLCLFWWQCKQSCRCQGTDHPQEKPQALSLSAFIPYLRSHSLFW